MSQESGATTRLQYPHAPCIDLSKSLTKINWLPLERIQVEKGNILVRTAAPAIARTLGSGRSVGRRPGNTSSWVVPPRCHSNLNDAPVHLAFVVSLPQPVDLRKAPEVVSELLLQAKMPPQERLRQITSQASAINNTSHSFPFPPHPHTAQPHSCVARMPACRDS